MALILKTQTIGYILKNTATQFANKMSDSLHGLQRACLLVKTNGLEYYFLEFNSYSDIILQS